ncbi:hypothetical protein [Micromonospora pallida]|uniref:hypothetical protein n=1 Tax=Micromonospora pallida TaxID=145854 RepID=UPI00114CB7AC|nr:hypothetical protein [Micromonospora pallida]
MHINQGGTHIQNNNFYPGMFGQKAHVLAAGTAVVMTGAGVLWWWLPNDATPPSPTPTPTSTFAVTAVSFAGAAEGRFIWYNRSIGIEGEVCDAVEPTYTRVRFSFYQGGNHLDDDGYLDQSHEVTAGCMPFGSTYGGPAGGITAVVVTLSDGEHSHETRYSRPPLRSQAIVTPAVTATH